MTAMFFGRKRSVSFRGSHGKINLTQKNNMNQKTKMFGLGAAAMLAMLPAHAALQITNGDFQQSATANNTDQVVGWFNSLPSGGISSGNWWEGTWYGSGNSPTGSPISGSSVMGLGYMFGSNWGYQSIGVNDGALSSITIDFNVGSFSDAGSNLRDMGITVGLYQASSFTGAYGTDIAGAAGVNLISTVSLSTGNLSVNQVVSELATLSLATANSTDPLYLRFVNFSPTSAAAGSGTAPWAAIDNVTIVPEPSTLALCGLGGLALLFRRRVKN
jgi:hypothetical protein